MKKFILLLLAVCIALSVTSCLPSYYKNVNDTPDENLPAPESMEELYSLYNTVSGKTTKAELDSAFGEAVPSYDDYGEVKFVTYFNETKSAGVSVIFDENDTVTTKTLYFNKKANLIPFSGRFDSDKISLVKSDMLTADALAVMGSSPLELSCAYGDSGPLDMDQIFCWYNEDGSNFMIHTETGSITNIVLYR
ncbi:MAG: hypothetical protein IKU65_04885 [Oscillospiraceae bacterium]|nr:hypothetical protein [Oscillospiraceae bacterium]